MLTVLFYSLTALMLVLFLSRGLSRRTRLLLALATLLLLGGPTLLVLLLQT